MLKNTGQYNKFIVVLLGTAASGLQQYYGNAHWTSIVISGITALSVFLVPNVPTNTTENVTSNVTPKV